MKFKIEILVFTGSKYIETAKAFIVNAKVIEKMLIFLVRITKIRL
jgi:hypothetical protein